MPNQAEHANATEVELLSALIAQVRHGDDCTSSDLAERLIRTGQVHVGRVTVATDGMAQIIWRVLVEHVSAYDSTKAAFLDWWTTGPHGTFTVPTWDMGEVAFTASTDHWSVSLRDPAGRHHHRVVAANRILATIRRALLASRASERPDAPITVSDLLLAWHDSTCPESGACRSRDLHARSAQSMAAILMSTLARLHIPTTEGTSR